MGKRKFPNHVVSTDFTFQSSSEPNSRYSDHDHITDTHLPLRMDDLSSDAFPDKVNSEIDSCSKSDQISFDSLSVEDGAKNMYFILKGSRSSQHDTLANSKSSTSSKLEILYESLSKSSKATKQPSLSIYEKHLCQVLEYIGNLQDPEHDGRLLLLLLDHSDTFTLLNGLIVQFSSREDVLQYVSSSICRLVSVPRFIPFILIAQIPATIIQTLAQFNASKISTNRTEIIISDFILILGNLSGDLYSSKAVRENKGIEMIIQCISRYKSCATIIDSSCYSLANLCVNNLDNMAIVLESNVLKMIIESMFRLINHEQLIESGLFFLSNVCTANQTAKELIAKKGGLRLICDILNEYPKQLMIIHVSLRTISILSQSSKVLGLILKENIVASIAFVIRNNQSVQSLELCFQVLSSIIHRCDHQQMSNIYKQDVFLLMMESARLHPMNLNIHLVKQQCISRVISEFPEILQYSDIKEQFLPDTLYTLRQFSNEKRIVKSNLILLASLSSDEMLRPIVTTETISNEIIQIVKNHEARQDSIFFIGLTTLCSFAHENSALILIKTELIDLCARLLSENIRNVQVVDVCLRTLTRLSFSEEAALVIARIALKPLTRSIQFHKASTDSEFLSMTCSIFMNLSSFSGAVFYLKSIVATVIIKLLGVDRKPNLSSQISYQFITILVKLCTADESSTVRQRLHELGAEDIIQNLSADYQKEYHSRLEESIRILFDLLKVNDEAKGGGNRQNLRRSSMLDINSMSSKSIIEATQARRRSLEHDQIDDSELKESSSIEFSTFSLPDNSSSEVTLEETMSSTLQHSSPRRSKIVSHTRTISRSLSPEVQAKTKRLSSKQDKHLDVLSESVYMDGFTSSLKELTISTRLSSTTHHILQSNLLDEWTNLLEIYENSSLELIQSCKHLYKLLSHSPKGIPESLRSKAWLLLSGGRTLKNEYDSIYYSELIRIFNEYGTPNDGEIDKDIPRTLPDSEYFQCEQGRNSLRRVLSAYSLRNPESVGYCQSMNTICGSLLTVMENEQDAFWMLCCIIEKRMGYYCRSMCSLLVDQNVLHDLICVELPELYNHLTDNEILVSSFTVSWILCHYVESPLPLKDSYQLWDYIFIYGDEIIFQFALILFRYAQKKIMALNGQSEILPYVLHGIVNDLPDINILLQSIQVGKFNEKIKILREYHRNHIVNEYDELRPTNIISMIEDHQWNFSDDELQSLWKSFLKPSPWHMLLYSSIPNYSWLQQSLILSCWPISSKEWRDHGLLSGLFQRLFDVLDTNQSLKIDFNEYLTGAHLLLKADEDEKLKFCHRFCDLNDDGVVDLKELESMITMLEHTFNGMSHAKERAREFCELIQDSQVDKDVLTFDDFCQYVLMHPLVCKFFLLDPLPP